MFVIPARGGSKEIPKKNIKLLGGKPLIYYSIEIARFLAKDENIFVSTDDKQIKNVVEQTGLPVPILRPRELSTDKSGIYEVLVHALDYYIKKGRQHKLVVLLQPTSPFRKVEHIKNAIDTWEPGIEMVVGVKITKANPYYLLFEENDKGYLVKSKDGVFQTRQECPPVYELNGAVYVIDVNCLLHRPIKAFNKIKKYVMDEFSSLDVDTMLDWKFAEFLLSENSQ